MRIALLGNASSIHLSKWAESLSNSGCEIHLISMQPFISANKGVTYHHLPFPSPFGYLLNLIELKKLLQTIKPDILHAHYATGYGTLAVLTGFHPFILSVWGSDIFVFPNKSFLHLWLLKHNLSVPDCVCSTSQAMAEAMYKILPVTEKTQITPFGIDVRNFVPQQKNKIDGKLVIGTIKRLHSLYGVDVLIKAFSILLNSLPLSQREQNATTLMIVGGGPDQQILQDLAKCCGVADAVNFVGEVPHSSVSEYLGKMDIFCALSRSESFGVAVLEASSCGVPVVVSNVGGLPEVVVDGVTGFIVPPDDPVSAADKIHSLIADAQLRESMGRKGREFVIDNYDWDACVKIMLGIYAEVAKNKVSVNL